LCYIVTIPPRSLLAKNYWLSTNFRPFKVTHRMSWCRQTFITSCH